MSGDFKTAPGADLIDVLIYLIRRQKGPRFKHSPPALYFECVLVDVWSLISIIYLRRCKLAKTLDGEIHKTYDNQIF
jgi:hypothetical protein